MLAKVVLFALVSVGLVGCGGSDGIVTPQLSDGFQEIQGLPTGVKFHHRRRGPKKPRQPRKPKPITGTIVVVGPWPSPEQVKERKASHLPSLVKRIKVWVERDGRQEGSAQTVTPEEPRATFTGLLVGKNYVVKGEGFDEAGRKVATGESDPVLITEFPRTVVLFLDDPRSSLNVEIRFRAH